MYQFCIDSCLIINSTIFHAAYKCITELKFADIFVLIFATNGLISSEWDPNDFGLSDFCPPRLKVYALDNKPVG